jgi:phosphopantothenoylcysteine synthetase/decarboxylase
MRQLLATLAPLAKRPVPARHASKREAIIKGNNISMIHDDDDDDDEDDDDDDASDAVSTTALLPPLQLLFLCTIANES